MNTVKPLAKIFIYSAVSVSEFFKYATAHGLKVRKDFQIHKIQGDDGFEVVFPEWEKLPSEFRNNVLRRRSRQPREYNYMPARFPKGWLSKQSKAEETVLDIPSVETPEPVATTPKRRGRKAVAK